MPGIEYFLFGPTEVVKIDHETVSAISEFMEIIGGQLNTDY